MALGATYQRDRRHHQQSTAAAVSAAALACACALLVACEALKLVENHGHNSSELLVRWDKRDGRGPSAVLIEVPIKAMWFDHSALLSEYTYDQQECGDGWAYAAAGQLEYHANKLYKRPEFLSAFSIADCAPRQGPSNDSAAYPLDAGLRYAIEHGVPTNQSYPIVGAECRAQCHADQPNVERRLQGCFEPELRTVDFFHNELSSHKVKQLLRSQPLIAGVAESLLESDLLVQLFDCDRAKATEGRIDHAVLLVGWGRLGELPFFKYKNSRGADWGDAGYGYMQMDHSSKCNTFSKIVYPVRKNC